MRTAKAFVRHFNRYRLRMKTSSFPTCLRAAYEFLINMFAESAGKKAENSIRHVMLSGAYGAFAQTP